MTPLNKKLPAAISFLDPLDDNIFAVENIAERLARIPRWGGRGKYFFSVAQHSVLTLVVLKRSFGKMATPSLCRNCLFHDAEEALLGFDPTPKIKDHPWLATPLASIKWQARALFAEQLILEDLTPQEHNLLKAVDSMAANLEASSLFPHHRLLQAGLDILDTTPFAHWLLPRDPIAAEELFMDEAFQLPPASPLPK